MDQNWPYVVAGYALTAGVLGTYAIWMLRKLHRVEHLGSVDPSPRRAQEPE